MASSELLEWASAHGIVTDGVSPAAVAEGGRGLVATRDLAPGVCILHVPQRLLMSAHSARQDPAMAAALAQLGSGGDTLSSEQLLAVHLLQQLSRGPDSFWHPYLQSLPRSYTTAACFREQDVALLQAPHAMAAVQAAADAVAAAWRGALPLFRELGLQGKWSSRQAYMWAAATLSSRTMYLPDDSAGCLTPLGDFANYAPPPPPYEPTLPASMGDGDGQGCCVRSCTQAADLRWQQQKQQQQQQQQQVADDIAGDGMLDAEAGEYRLYSRQRCVHQSSLQLHRATH